MQRLMLPDSKGKLTFWIEDAQDSRFPEMVKVWRPANDTGNTKFVRYITAEEFQAGVDIYKEISE